jgi:hypothetical protein
MEKNSHDFSRNYPGQVMIHHTQKRSQGRRAWDWQRHEMRLDLGVGLREDGTLHYCGRWFKFPWRFVLGLSFLPYSRFSLRFEGALGTKENEIWAFCVGLESKFPPPRPLFSFCSFIALRFAYPGSQVHGWTSATATPTVSSAWP